MKRLEEMNRILKFKAEVEAIASKNFADYDAVEYDERYDCDKYNEAVDKINKYKRMDDFYHWSFIFSDKEMLNLNVMYACIRCGAIESDLTKKLNDDWAAFASHFER